jgi:16S rRNA (adenine1518-N6/adenine1519-N6)-dimethyltransferase
VFLEIGPGHGALTFALAPRVARVVAVEIDRDLGAELRQAAPSNVEVVVADFLDSDVRRVMPAGATTPYRVVGNLPYNISSPILFRLLATADAGRFFSDATLMLQREVADRLAAPAGSREYGVLSILAQMHADVRRLLALPPGAFRPVPKVQSAVVGVRFRAARVEADPALFQAMVRAMFGQRRKGLVNALKAFAEDRGVSAAAVVTQAGLDPLRRPETLELTELARLAELFASAGRA